MLIRSIFGGLLFVGGSALADTVYLTDGETFEGVEAVLTESQVLIEMPIGRMTLPLDRVLRIEDSPSLMAAFQARERKLLVDPESDAEDWLTLALWARAKGYRPGLKKAALTARQHDPGLEGLAPLLRGLGLVYDAEYDEWITRTRSMQQRGFVRDDAGEWVSQAEHDANLRSRAQAAAEARDSRADDHLDRALEIIEEKTATRDEPGPSMLRAITGEPHGSLIGIALGLPAFHPTQLQSVASHVEGGVISAGSSFSDGSPFEAVADRIPGSFLPIR